MRSGFDFMMARRRRSGGKWLRTAVGLTATLAACKGALDVPVPSRIPADELEVPANAQLLANGAIADFDCALGAYVVVAGLMTDELEDATLTADRWPYDQRNIAPSQRRYSTFECEDIGTYVPVNRARASADNVLRLLRGWTDAQLPSGVNRTSLIAAMAAYGGYARVLLGEMFCTGVISYVDANKNIVFGSEITDQRLFTSADSLFSIAIDAATQSGSGDVLTLAYLGRARARLNLGRKAEAAADAANVPAGFVYYATASVTTTRRANRVYEESNPESGRSSPGRPATCSRPSPGRTRSS